MKAFPDLMLGSLKQLNNCKCKGGIVIWTFRSKQAQSIALGKHYKNVYLSPLGNSKNTQMDTYIKLLEFNFNNIKKSDK